MTVTVGGRSLADFAKEHAAALEAEDRYRVEAMRKWHASRQKAGAPSQGSRRDYPGTPHLGKHWRTLKAHYFS